MVWRPSGEFFQRDFRCDSAKRLCLMRDPEAGLTCFGYNLAGDLNRSVEGASLPVFSVENDLEQCGAFTP